MGSVCQNEAGEQVSPALIEDEAWIRLLAREDAGDLINLLSRYGCPWQVGGTPWAVLLMRKVAVMHWHAGSNWKSPFIDGWRQVWTMQEHIDPELWPELLLEMLWSIGKGEKRFKTGNITWTHWLELLDVLVEQGANLDTPIAWNGETLHFVDILLRFSTQKAYPIIAWDIMCRYGTRFMPLEAEQLIDVLDRCIDADVSQTDQAKDCIISIAGALIDVAPCHDHKTYMVLSTWLDIVPDQWLGDPMKRLLDSAHLKGNTGSGTSSARMRRL